MPKFSLNQPDIDDLQSKLTNAVIALNNLKKESTFIDYLFILRNTSLEIFDKCNNIFMEHLNK